MKSDEQLLAESNALDAAYAGAETFDLRKENEYLSRVLWDLYHSVSAEFPADHYGKHLNSAMNEAAVVLGIEE